MYTYSNRTFLAQAIPATRQTAAATESLQGCEKLRIPQRLDNGLTDGGETVSLTHRSPFKPTKIPGTHFSQRLSRPQGHSAVERIVSYERCNLIGSRTPHVCNRTVSGVFWRSVPRIYTREDLWDRSCVCEEIAILNCTETNSL
jgi:hypothetical protein